ncbi:MAG TPA: sigma 54-interacting transcriptional regulator [Myxococcota bacterium]|nr:sigma 54-interacting transcriptional regulator [Myxococcota bacterium]
MTDLGARREVQGDGGGADPRTLGRRRGDRVVGASRAMQEAIEQAMAAASTDQPVRIAGPPGSGKDHLARCIHAWSRRSSGAYVVVSCVGVAAPLLGRELFGCTASVYPTLPDDYDGGLARAAGGTLVIDHADRLPGAVRETLSKGMAEGRYLREGDAAPRPLRARLIAISHEPLPRSPFGDVPQLSIEVPPLSARGEDVLPLAAHFLRLFADEEGLAPVGFTAEARNALLTEAWPGNVRELAERVRQALRLTGNGAISAEALMLSAELETIPSFKDAKRAFERRYVSGLLRRCEGNISHAARLAKKDRKDFYDVIRRTGVDPGDFR